jgi:type VI secretion system secreted protein VgrG
LNKTSLLQRRYLIQALQDMLDQLESLQEMISVDRNEITLKAGDASIVMKRDGTITIRGKDITIQGSGKVSVRANGDLALKGAKVVDN